MEFDKIIVDDNIIEDDIKFKIQTKLKQIELKYDITIIYACESGSRAWGFASNDSDYDVRFIYKYKLTDYLKIKPEKDTIIEEIDSDLIDASGWELKKALNLLSNYNAVLIDWLYSPIVYYQNDIFVEEIRKIIEKYYSPKFGFYHYYHLANKHYNKYIKDKEFISPKKYFYILRGLLAAKWLILYKDKTVKKNRIVPVKFSELYNNMVKDDNIKSIIKTLLENKKNSVENEKIAVIPELNEFITNLMGVLVDKFSENNKFSEPIDIEKLNRFFSYFVIC